MDFRASIDNLYFTGSGVYLLVIKYFPEKMFNVLISHHHQNVFPKLLTVNAAVLNVPHISYHPWDEHA